MGVNIPVGYGQANILLSLTGKPSPFVVTVGYDRTVTNLPTPTENAVTIRTMLATSGKLLHPEAYSSVYTFLGVKVTEMTLTGPVIGEAPASAQGSLAATVLPPNCAVLVRKVTARGGRKGRGRMFVPPMTILEGQVDSLGMWSVPTSQAWADKFNTWRTDMATAGLPMVLLHSDPALTPDPISNLVVQGTIATQRRRLR